MENFHGFENSAPHEQEIPADVQEYVQKVTRRRIDARELNISQVMFRLEDVPEHLREQVLKDPATLDTIIQCIVKNRGEKETPNTASILERFKTAPETVHPDIISSPKFMEALRDSVVRITSDTRGPGTPQIMNRIGAIIDVIPELRDPLLHDPKVIEAIVTYVAEPERPTKSRIEGVPDEIKKIVLADPRVQEKLKK